MLVVAGLDGFDALDIFGDGAERLALSFLQNDAIEVHDAILHRDREAVPRHPDHFRQPRVA